MLRDEDVELFDDFEEKATEFREDLMTFCANGADDDLPEDTRPDRAEVIPGCLLKYGDIVEVNAQTVYYLCPGRGLGWFYGMLISDGLAMLGQWEAIHVIDRRPADPEEDPMPILPEITPLEAGE